ncbi:MaoC family dehydratase [Actinomycetospora sp. NBRC 106375]|uniref:MaoC family dehydratase n=1 Tax=Actinomycetospora sp. NBRC 106375 TaxID=3032207 RepID=UPI0024A30F0D|nr:MaoC family dehydratase [Actinomycetospora sp. NBRC 106375]GLZ49869.1 MaoC family dehydratase [Actinomycetospora sp. NBRC 106375]
MTARADGAITTERPVFDPGDFELVEKGPVFETFEVGQQLEHHWGRTLSETDAVLFGSLTLNYAPLYTNAHWSRQLGHEQRPINAYFVFLTVLGLSVEDTSERDGGMFLGVDSVDFLAPVYPGGTLTARSEVLAVRDSKSRPTAGIVTWRTTGYVDSREPVLELVRTNLVVRGSAS